MESRPLLDHGVDPEALRALLRRSDFRGSAQLALHVVLLGGTAASLWSSRGSYWLLPAIVTHGIALNFLFCALHETTHRTAFAGRRANDTVAWLCGALLLLPPQYFRLFHYAHHRFTQDAARDPELQQPHPRTWQSYLWRASGLPNWRRRLAVTLRHAWTGRAEEPFLPVIQRPAIVRESRVLWGCYLLVLVLSLLFRSSAALLYWILPAVAGQPFLRLYLLSEHAGCSTSSNTFANTRTTLTNALMRTLAWQMPYHIEHHVFPAVPFHALAKINGAIRSRIVTSATGYCSVQLELMRGLRKHQPSRSHDRVDGR